MQKQTRLRHSEGPRAVAAHVDSNGGQPLPLSRAEILDLQIKIDALTDNQLDRLFAFLQPDLGATGAEEDVRLDIEELSPTRQRALKQFVSKEIAAGPAPTGASMVERLLELELVGAPVGCAEASKGQPALPTAPRGRQPTTRSPPRASPPALMSPEFPEVKLAAASPRSKEPAACVVKKEPAGDDCQRSRPGDMRPPVMSSTRLAQQVAPRIADSPEEWMMPELALPTAFLRGSCANGKPFSVAGTASAPPVQPAPAVSECESEAHEEDSMLAHCADVLGMLA